MLLSLIYYIKYKSTEHLQNIKKIYQLKNKKNVRNKRKDMSEEIKIDPYGFREYDARWLYKKSINQLGIENLGKGLGTQIIKHTKKNNPRVIVGHDYRSYS